MIQLRKVVRRVAIGEATRVVKRWDGTVVGTIPRAYEETLDCGCTRTVSLSNQQATTGHQVRYYNAYDIRRPVDVLRDLEPHARICAEHSPVATTPARERAAYLTRMRAFNSHLRVRAKERGLQFP